MYRPNNRRGGGRRLSGTYGPFAAVERLIQPVVTRHLCQTKDGAGFGGSTNSEHCNEMKKVLQVAATRYDGDKYESSKYPAQARSYWEKVFLEKQETGGLRVTNTTLLDYFQETTDEAWLLAVYPATFATYDEFNKTRDANPVVASVMKQDYGVDLSDVTASVFSPRLCERKMNLYNDFKLANWRFFSETSDNDDDVFELGCGSQSKNLNWSSHEWRSSSKSQKQTHKPMGDSRMESQWGGIKRKQACSRESCEMKPSEPMQLGVDMELALELGLSEREIELQREAFPFPRNAPSSSRMLKGSPSTDSSAKVAQRLGIGNRRMKDQDRLFLKFKKQHQARDGKQYNKQATQSKEALKKGAWMSPMITNGQVYGKGEKLYDGQKRARENLLLDRPMGGKVTVDEHTSLNKMKMFILQEHSRLGMPGVVETTNTLLRVYNCKEQPASKFLSALAKDYEHADQSVHGDTANFIQAMCSLAEMEVTALQL